MTDKRYTSDIAGVCEWACDSAGLSFAFLRPQDVTVVLKDGRRIPFADPAQPPFEGKDVRAVEIKHRDSAEPILVDVLDRRH